MKAFRVRGAVRGRVFCVHYLFHELLSIRQPVDQSLDDLKDGSGLHGVRRHSAKQAGTPKFSPLGQQRKSCWPVNTAGLSPRLRRSIGPQPVHDQCAEDHGQVGAAHPHLAAEEQRGQPPGGAAVAQRQAGALLEGGREGAAG